MQLNRLSYLLSFLVISQLCFSQQMPLDFADSGDNFIGFSGSGFAFNSDPTDGSNAVGQFFNDGSNASQGFFLDLIQPIDLDFQKTINLSFYSFDPNNHNIVLKLENGANPDVQVRLDFAVPSPSDWLDLTFDFANAVYSSNGVPVDATGTYSRITVFIDEGNLTSGTYLIDDIDDASVPTDPHELDVIYDQLVWSDEFDTPGAIDPTKWFHQTQLPAGGNWFNGEEQHYTNRIENSFVEDGLMKIVAIKEEFTDQGETKSYTSARLNSKYAFTYGRVDVRAKLPLGDGTWPAIWTLGKNINEDGAYWDNQGFGTTTWPACGEIDIMEHGLGPVNHTSSAIHTPSSFGNTMNTASQEISDVANNFHVYSVNWSPNQITFLVDDVGFYTYNPTVQDASTWPFDLEQYMILNIAMGGIAGTIAPTFTQSSMEIDYVRIYEESPLDRDDIAFSDVRIFPNPAATILNVSSSTAEIKNLEMYNLLGRRVLFSQDSRQLKVDELSAGIYLLKVYSENTVTTKRVIIE